MAVIPWALIPCASGQLRNGAIPAGDGRLFAQGTNPLGVATLWQGMARRCNPLPKGCPEDAAGADAVADQL